MIRYPIFMFVVVFNFTACLNKSNPENKSNPKNKAILEKYIFRDKDFAYDTYFIENKLINTLTKDSSLINISDNKIYVYDNFFCENEWILGKLTEVHNKTLSFGNCGNSSLITNLSSELTSIDTVDNKLTYTFNLLISTNTMGAKIFRKSFTYNEEEGIIKIKEADTLIYFPMFETASYLN